MPVCGSRLSAADAPASQYRMGFDKNFNDQNDTVFEFEGLKVFIDKSQPALYGWRRSRLRRRSARRRLQVQQSEFDRQLRLRQFV